MTYICIRSFAFGRLLTHVKQSIIKCDLLIKQQQGQKLLSQKMIYHNKCNITYHSTGLLAHSKSCIYSHKSNSDS